MSKSSLQPQVQTIHSAADKAKLGLAVACLVGGIVAFYWLASAALWLRVLTLLLLFLLGLIAFFLSESGKALIAYGKDSVREVRKVVWPSRKEAMQMTGYVFVFVALMSIFLWLTDKTLEWVFYDLILGWRN